MVPSTELFPWEPIEPPAVANAVEFDTKVLLEIMHCGLAGFAGALPHLKPTPGLLLMIELSEVTRPSLSEADKLIPSVPLKNTSELVTDTKVCVPTFTPAAVILSILE